MKKVLMAMAVCLLTACESGYYGGEPVSEEQPIEMKTKKFTFNVKGDFASPVFSGDELTNGMKKAAALSADGQDMTDLWVFDYMDGALVQSVHQTNEDADFGKPIMQLQYGSHHVYFVASRGVGAAVDGSVMTWSSVKDTFWKDYEVDVVSTSNGNRAVTLDRVVTKLKMTAIDEVPAGCASVTITPATWYYGLDYTTGQPTAAQTKDVVINVPSSYIGTTGSLVMSIFSFSTATEWTTDVTLTAKDSGGDVLGQATITNAPFKANRCTEYSGPLFGTDGEIIVGLNAEWETSFTGIW